MRVLSERLLGGVVALAFLLVIGFALPRLTPGDPAVALYGAESSAQDRARIRESLGLDRPFGEALMSWLGGVARGDFGSSLRTGEPALEMALVRLPRTAILGLSALALGITFGSALGIVGATFRGRRLGSFAVGLASALSASPGFWLGLIFLYLFAYQFRILPFGGMAPVGGSSGDIRLENLLLPSLALGAREAGRVGLILRESLLGVLSAPYLRVAYGKGLSKRLVLLRHALPNALPPVVGALGVSLSYLLSGALAVETVFAWPGLGRLMAESAAARDYPVLSVGIVLAGLIAFLANLASDLVIARITPRADR